MFGSLTRSNQANCTLPQMEIDDRLVGIQHYSPFCNNEDLQHNYYNSEPVTLADDISVEECQRGHDILGEGCQRDDCVELSNATLNMQPNGHKQSQAYHGQRSSSQEYDNNIPSSSNHFWYMPPFPQSIGMSFNASARYTSGDIYIGHIFGNKQELRRELSMMALKKHFQLKVTRSSPDRFEAKCMSDQCNWRIRATSFGDNSYF